MNIEELRDYCLSLKFAEEGFPFDTDTLVFTVKGKMFCLTNIDNFESLNVKCEPEKAIVLREQYDEVIPGYHMNKTHWNTIKIDGRLSDKLIKEWVKDSYELVVSKLPKKMQAELKSEF